MVWWIDGIDGWTVLDLDLMLVVIDLYGAGTGIEIVFQCMWVYE